MLCAILLCACRSGVPMLPDGDTAEPGDTAALTFGPALPFGLPEETVRPQHHATVAVTPSGQVVAAWTLGELFQPHEAWLRVAQPDGTSVRLLSLGTGMRAKIPDVEIGADGVALIGMEVDGVGVGLQALDLTGSAGGDRPVALLGDEAVSGGGNIVDIAPAPDGSVFAAWYSGDTDQPGVYRAGGIGAVDSGAVAVAGFGNMQHTLPNPPDVVATWGGAAIAWADAQPDIERLVVTRSGAPGELGAEVVVETLVPNSLLVPRPALAADSAGRLAIAWRRGPKVGQRTLFVATVGTDDRVDGPLALPFGGDRPDVALIGDELLLIAYEQDDGIFVAALSFPALQVLIPPVRITDPSVVAERPSLATRAMGPNNGTFAVSYEKRLLDVPRTLQVVVGAIDYAAR